MVKSEIISALKANHLYWLGRYENRVYLTLHQLGKCYDMMIDGDEAQYDDLRHRLDVDGAYADNQAFTLGILYDEENPSSLISAQKCAQDNAILLREDIMSETLSYLEMSVALLRKSQLSQEPNPTALQPIIDWAMAFWGSAEQRLQNHRALDLMMIGRNVENLDMLLRFGYPYRRVMLAYESLKRYCQDEEFTDPHIAQQIDSLLTPEQFEAGDESYRYALIALVNQLARV